jgi:hypothetical protein
MALELVRVIAFKCGISRNLGISHKKIWQKSLFLLKKVSFSIPTGALVGQRWHSSGLKLGNKASHEADRRRCAKSHQPPASTKLW